MIVGNIRTEPLDSVHGEASSLDPTAYLPQRDKAKVLLVLMAEQKRQNESNMDVPEARITAPKTVSEKNWRDQNRFGFSEFDGQCGQHFSGMC